MDILLETMTGRHMASGTMMRITSRRKYQILVSKGNGFLK
jgi:hypothetical protein